MITADSVHSFKNRLDKFWANEEAINWRKTKLQVFDDTSTPPSKASVLNHDVEVV